MCGLFAVRSGLLTSGEKADRLRLRLKPFGIKKPDQTGLLNTKCEAVEQYQAMITVKHKAAQVVGHMGRQGSSSEEGMGIRQAFIDAHISTAEAQGIEQGKSVVVAFEVWREEDSVQVLHW